MRLYLIVGWQELDIIGPPLLSKNTKITIIRTSNNHRQPFNQRFGHHKMERRACASHIPPRLHKFFSTLSHQHRMMRNIRLARADKIIAEKQKQFDAWAAEQSQFGIIGIAYGIGIVMQTLLNFFSISGSIGFYWSIRPYIEVGICMMLMAICGHWTYDYLTVQGLPLLWSVIVSIV